jgi:hypothetical protein
LIYGSVTNQTLTVRKGHARRGHAIALIVWNDYNLIVSPNTDVAGSRHILNRLEIKAHLGNNTHEQVVPRSIPIAKDSGAIENG